MLNEYFRQLFAPEKDGSRWLYRAVENSRERFSKIKICENANDWFSGVHAIFIWCAIAK